MAAILRAAGRPTGVIGTLHGPRTTPEAPELQAELRQFRDEGAAAAVLEVSSHALALHRARRHPIRCRRVHQPRSRPSRPPRVAGGVLPGQGVAVRRGVRAGRGRQRRRPPRSAARRRGDDPRSCRSRSTTPSIWPSRPTGHRYTWRGHDVVVPLGGRFNVSNSLAAATTAEAIGIDADVAARALAGVAQVPGRFELVDSPIARQRAITVVVDYAHTPDGLARSCSTRRATATDGAVIVVFGCGGDRDRDKRPEMGAIAAGAADTRDRHVRQPAPRVARGDHRRHRGGHRRCPPQPRLHRGRPGRGDLPCDRRGRAPATSS